MKTPINKDNLDQLFNKAKADKQGLDDFEKDAIEGFDMLESEQEAADLKASLDTRIQKELFAKEEEKNPKIYWFAAAGLILVVGLSVLFILNNNDSLSKSHDLAITNTVQENEKNVLPDSKAELKEETIAPPTEAATLTDEESPAKKTEEKLKSGKLDLQDQAGEKDMVAATTNNKVAQDEKETKPRMVVAASTKGPVDIKQIEKEQSERKKEVAADEMTSVGSGSNSKNNNTTAGIDDLAKGSKDKEGEAFKSITTKTPDQKAKLAETESTPKNEVAYGSPKEKAKKEDRRNDNDAEEDLNQPVAINMDKNTSVNREEKAGKKAKRANNKQSATGAVSENNDYKPGSPNITTTKDAIVLENTASAEAQKEPAINCYYTGGETAATTDLRDKLKGKDIDQKFDVTLFVNEKKMVEKVEYINSYDLTAKQKDELTKILKTLCKFNFFVNPTTKGLFPYKIIYRP
ncbi:MAG: hypothetical protein Q8L81_13270 [Bacteroidota bacterium]|nr:hypothetical protein [Bacteroidota bacterium]